jgi:hypothetical protein
MSDAKFRAEPSCGVADGRISVSERLWGWHSACTAGSKLGGLEIHNSEMTEGDQRIVRHGAAARTFEGEQGSVEPRTGIND